MGMLTVVLMLLALSTASMHIRAEYKGPRSHVYLFKPLTMVVILMIAVSAALPEGSLYSLAIIAGLICSLAGDVLLMLPSDRFIAGLVSFLVAHLLYTAGFISGTGFGFSSWLALPFVLYGAVMFGVLSPHLGRMKLAVSVYMAGILVMAWQAWERYLLIGERGALLASLGAVLFVVSDSALALNRFRGQFKSAQALTLRTYYAAQWLIALSGG